MENKKGFTLIELLIVVVIIGILAAIAIPKFGETRQRAYVSAMQADLNQVRTAQEMYYQDNTFTYAPDYATLAAALDLTASEGVTIVIAAGAAAGDWSATATHVAAPGQQCTYDSGIGVIDCGAAAAP